MSNDAIDRCDFLKSQTSSSMTPCYDGQDFYKKMLEVQSALRKSEEERIRLEERFNILMLESRNRRNACINRLRMKYIEFLEEQQLKIERNHKLLGALDKVDSSLAVMTTETDKLNELRKQYESFLRESASRQNAGSTTGDSGIASQNEEQRARRSVASQVNMTTSHEWSATEPKRTMMPKADLCPSISYRTRVPLLIMRSPSIADSNSTKIPSQDRPITLYKYIFDPNDAVNKTPTTTFTATMTTTTTTSATALQNYADTSMITRQPTTDVADPNALLELLSLRTRTYQEIRRRDKERKLEEEARHRRYDLLLASTSKRPPRTDFRSEYSEPFTKIRGSSYFQRKEPLTPPRSPSYYDRQADNADLTLFPSIPFESTSLEPTRKYSTFPKRIDDPITTCNASSRYAKDILGSRWAIADTPPSIKIDSSAIRSPRATAAPVDIIDRRMPTLRKSPIDLDKHNRGVKFFDDQLDSQVSTFRKSPVDPDEQIRTRRYFEDELHRRISKIGNLHRELDQQSIEEPDHEQNTSGDLLNVTLSDDGSEIPVEKWRDEPPPPQMKNVLALADNLVARLILANAEDEPKAGETVEKEKASLETKDKIDKTPLRVGQEPVDGANRGLSTLATSREDIGKELLDDDGKELERGTSNDVAGVFDQSKKSIMDPEVRSNDAMAIEHETGKAESENETEADGQEDERAFLESMEMETKEDFSYAKELEPWDMKDVTRKIRDVSLEDGEGAEDAAATQAVDENATVENVEAERIDKVRVGDENEKKSSLSNDVVEEGQEEAKRSLENNANLDSNIGQTVCEDNKNTELNEVDNTVGQRDMVDEGNSQRQTEDGVHVQDSDQNQEYQYDQTDPNSGYEAPLNQDYNDYANDQYAEYGQYEQDPNAQYEQDLNARYEQDPNLRYEQDPNAQYEQDPNAQYELDPNAQYEQDPNAQYEQDPNAQYELDPNAQYEQDPNAQYEQDPNAQYEQDPNAQYEQDPNAQYEQDPNVQYEQDPNTQYEQDPNAQFEQDPNAQYEQDPNAQYEQDPNMQYEQDPNAQYEQDPNAQYEQDPNMQYEQDPNAQYEQDPNAQYEQDPNAQYKKDPNVQYEQDPNAQYEQDPNAQYEQDPNAQYEQDPNAQYEQEPSAQYEQDPNAQYEENTNEEDKNVSQTHEDNASNEKSSEGDPNGTEERSRDEIKEGPDTEKTSGNYEDEEKLENNADSISDQKEESAPLEEANQSKKKDVIMSLLDSDTDSTIERNTSNTESDFNFN